MKTFDVIRCETNSGYQGWADNDCWDLTLRDENGLHFRSEAFMCMGRPGDKLTLSEPQIAVLKPALVIE